MEQDMKIKIGMRNIKTAVSVFICVLLFKVLQLGNPFTQQSQRLLQCRIPQATRSRWDETG
jgi:hypothetical protein